jgi:hypothetical protein
MLQLWLAWHLAIIMMGRCHKAAGVKPPCHEWCKSTLDWCAAFAKAWQCSPHVRILAPPAIAVLWSLVACRVHNLHGTLVLVLVCHCHTLYQTYLCLVPEPELVWARMTPPVLLCVDTTTCVHC